MKNKPLIFGLVASALVFGLTCCVGIFSFAFQHHIENAGGGASVGDACDRATDCDVTAGQSCMHDDAGGFCTTRCQTSDVCAPGWVCEGSTITRNGAGHIFDHQARLRSFQITAEELMLAHA